MDDSDVLGGLRGLFQDLSALSRSTLPNIERLVLELEATVQDFRKLLDKPPKSNESRQAVLSGRILHKIIINIIKSMLPSSTDEAVV